MKNKIFILCLGLLCFVFYSCEDWLKATSATEISTDDLYSTDEGFHTALTGVYIGMAKSEAYGMRLTWHMPDFLAHYYGEVANSNDLNLHTHQYRNNPASGYIKSVWDGLYSLIAQCNDILENLEKNKARLNPLNYQLVKGEALALRAYLHFDLMRLFGYGNLRNRTIDGARAIPYVTVFSKEVTPQRTYAETLDLLKRDLLEAIELLYGENGENCFRITNNRDYFLEANGNSYIYLQSGYSHGYFTSYSIESCPRIDYYAAKAILARVYMWEGTDRSYAEALKIAEEWFATQNTGWRWVTRSRVTTATIASRDRTFSEEHIWHIQVAKLNDILGDWLNASGLPITNYNYLYLPKNNVYEIFEVGTGNNVGTGDYRYAYLLEAQGTAGNFATLKLSQNGGNTNYGRMIPLLSTPELYYIGAEVLAEQGDLAKAVSYLNAVRTARGIAQNLSAGLSYDEVKKEILKEYRKEFVNLGQLFYFYKRLGIADIVGYSGAMTDAEYVLPYPDDEITFGDRVQ
jgi:hypothetical protein